MTHWGDRLETERLVLRGRRPEEAAVYRQLWAERDPRVPARRRIDAGGRPTVDDVAEQVRAEAAYDGLVVLAVERRDTGEVVGYCGLFAVEGRPADEPELAFELLAAAQGRGYATEAARAVVEHARASGVVRLWADVWGWNRPSLRVLDKLGFAESSRTEVEGRGENLTLVLDLATPPEAQDEREDNHRRNLRDQLHVHEGLAIVLADLHGLLDVVLDAPDVDAARRLLRERFGLSAVQADAALDLQVRRAPAGERQKIDDRRRSLAAALAALDD